MLDDKELNLEHRIEITHQIVDAKVKEIINALFAKLGLSNRVDEISKVPQKHILPTRIRNLINEVANKNELRKEAQTIVCYTI
ncbi:hypothetical protein [Orientia tsutsugamushi]|uniref:hypothetical protein n=1 Tax=Orientia tsutsugamushi TaxID=784 RepID=UPI0040470408